MNAEKSTGLQPFCRQFIAITPRSGSTWWCDLLSRAGLGKPAEYLNEAGLWRKTYPLCPQLSAWDELHSGMAASSGEVAYDLKASWFQFQPLLDGKLGTSVATDGFDRTVWSYLSRQNLPAQALSLYLMRRLGSAHTRKGHAPLTFSESWFEPADANLDAIMCWVLHVAQQEYGWETFFAQHNIEPWRRTYEQIAARPITSVCQYIEHTINAGMHGAEQIENPRGAARRAARLSRLVKREYPEEQAEALLGDLSRKFGRELAIIGEKRGKEPAAALRKISGLRKLDQREMETL
jgi:LPS sulfotransferase NodH